LAPGVAEDSISFAPALQGQALAKGRTAVVHHSGTGLFAIRDREWKLVLGRGSGGFTAPAKVVPGPGEPEGELYHLLSDPREEHNLYAEQPAVVARLKDQLATWQRQGRSR
jgi:arylsulfatase A-like enzyme